MIHLDTHVVVWLFAPRPDLLSPSVKDCLERDDLVVSPMVLLELDYLRETGRLAVGAETIFQSLQTSIGLGLCDVPFARVIQAAAKQTWTRDPFDRIIVGQATAARRRLVTRDQTILEHFPGAIW